MQEAGGVAGHALARNLLKGWKCCDAFVISRLPQPKTCASPCVSGVVVIVNTSADWQNRAAERNSEGVRPLDAQEAWVPSRGRGRR